MIVSARFVKCLATISMLATSLFFLNACSKRCDSATGCQRTCPCTDSESGLTFDCNMTFLCDVEAKVCDPMHSASCDDICQQYAASGICGKQCTKTQNVCKAALAATQEPYFASRLLPATRILVSVSQPTLKQVAQKFAQLVPLIPDNTAQKSTASPLQNRRKTNDYHKRQHRRRNPYARRR